MRKAPNQDSQRPDQRDDLFSLVVSVLTPKVLGVLAALLGTACTIALATKPQQAPRPAASAQTAVKPLIVQLTTSETARNLLSQAKAQVTKEVVKVWHPVRVITSQSGYSVDSSVDTNALLAPIRLEKQKRQQPLNKQWRQRDPEGQQQLAALKLAAQLAAQTTPSPQASVGLQTSSELAFFSAVTLKPAEALQNNQNRALAEVISQAQLPQGQPVDPVVKTRLQQNQQESAPKEREVKLTLSDIVILALENNRPLKNVYLERIVQRQELAVAEDKFAPNFSPTVSVSFAQFESDRITSNGGLGAGVTVSVKVPSGGELSFSWAVNGQTAYPNGFSIEPNGDLFEPNLQLSFNQPLLRGAGINLNRASIDIARLTEQVNILALKSTLINTITEAIFAYRKLLRAQERLKIEQRSLELAQQILEVNRILIEAGRLAPVDIVQSQTAVANRQVSLLAAQNNLEAAKLALIDLLDIEQNLNIVAAETTTAKPTTLDSNKLAQLALENRPDYLRAQINQKISQLQLLLAEDDKRWDLNLITSLNNTANRNSDVRAGLVLTREFGDLTKEQRFVRSQVNLLQAENTLRDLDNSIKIQVADGIRNVNLRFSQVELARQATVLSERQLEIEREKQKLGRSGIFELVRLQNELVDARNAELDATIEYLNALTRLDQTLGTTLVTWQVTFDRQ